MLALRTAHAANDILSGFLPHGVCYTWNRDLMWLHVISDSLIGVAYFSIPFALAYFVRKRRDRLCGIRRRALFGEFTKFAPR